MVAPQNGVELADDLHQRLDPAGVLLAAAAESAVGQREDLAQRVLDHMELLFGRLGKAGAVLRHPGGDIRDADGVVAQTFEFRGHFEILVEDRDVLLKLQMGQQLDRVAAAAVGEVVDVLFLREDLPMESLVVALEQTEGFFDVRASGAEERQQQLVAAVQGQRRRVEEAGVQRFELGTVLLLPDGLRLVLHDAAAELFIDAEHREQADGAAQVEDRIGVGDHAGVHRALPKAVQQAEPVDHGDAEEHQHCFAEVK